MNKKTNHKQVALIILDGWGYREDTKDNAVAAAQKPFFDSLWNNTAPEITTSHTLLEASGSHVGLPDGQMGNSEIGHTTIGAGKIIDTDLVRIKKAIDSNEFDRNPAFTKVFDHVKSYDSTLHLQGLIGNGGVHAHSDHLFALLRAAKKAGVKRVAIHAFTDGRDTAPQSAARFMKELEDVIAEVGIGHIATIAGRFYAMDRDNNWDRLARVEKAIFECKVDGDHNICTIKPSAKLDELYKAGKVDEHIEPMIFVDDRNITDESIRRNIIKENDGVIFTNFRSDRARMLSSKLLDMQARLAKQGHNICFVTMTEYSADFKCLVAFPSITIESTLAGEISKANLHQAHIAETEKFPHATYFLNGGKEKPYNGEVHIMLESRKDVKTHDLAPKMRAEGIADKAIEQIEAGVNFIFINFANPDMVGHTANVPAIIEAIEEVDKQLKRVVNALVRRDGLAFITADHGNAEVNVDPVTGDKHTAHTINPVPALLVQSNEGVTRFEFKRQDEKFGLSDIAPTILHMLGLKPSSHMTGKVIVKESQ